MKLKTDIASEGAQAAFETMWHNSPLLQEFRRQQVQELADSFKVISFDSGVPLTKHDEPIEWFGIIAEGKAVVRRDDVVLGRLETGDVIGYMELSGVDKVGKHEFDINALTRGYIAVITLTDLKVLRAKRPALV